MINESLGKTEMDFENACEQGFVLSVDNGHAVHPAHPEKSDINAQIKLNGGIMIKHNSNYATNGLPSALLKNMLNKSKIIYQDFYCNSDQSCASTVGLIISSILHINACEIGLAQLAMHSAIETKGSNDIESMNRCCNNFLKTAFNHD